MPATKDEIAAKFMELAFRFGYRRTAVEDVARELRISKKTIYEHFSSKEDLMRCALELGACGQRARVEGLLTETTALGRVVEVVGVAGGEFDVPDPDATAAFAVAMGMEAVRMICDDPTSHAEEALLDGLRRLIGGTPSPPTRATHERRES